MDIPCIDVHRGEAGSRHQTTCQALTAKCGGFSRSRGTVRAVCFNIAFFRVVTSRYCLIDSELTKNIIKSFETSETN